MLYLNESSEKCIHYMMKHQGHRHPKIGKNYFIKIKVVQFIINIEKVISVDTFHFQTFGV